MDQQPQIGFFAAKFDARAHSDLEMIRSDTAADKAAYELGCDRGEMNCVAIKSDGVRVGTLICSWMDEGEIVFVCNAVRVEQIDGHSMTQEIFELCSVWARSHGAQRVRFWTARKGLAAATAALGFNTMYVMEKDITNVGRT